MPEPIDILENRLLEEDPELLRILLSDRTTGQPIFWATDSYSELGEGYQWHDPITPEAVTGEHGALIMPRVAKSSEEQRRRSKQMAEVFTPSWLDHLTQNHIIRYHQARESWVIPRPPEEARSGSPQHRIDRD